MKKLFNLFLLGVLALSSLQAQNLQWAKQIGGINEDIIKAMTTDADGNVYITGRFYGTLDFDPGPGVSQLSVTSWYGIFVCKYDVSGNLVWAKQMGVDSDNSGLDIFVDNLGYVYTTGQFAGVVDFDPGAGTFNLTSAGKDIFVSKLNSAGDFVWALGYGGSWNEAGRTVTVDATGSVYVASYFQGTIDFDPGVGVYNLTSSVNNDDIVISKFNSSGNFVWAKSMGGTGWETAYSVALDADANVFLSGYFQGTVDFDPGAGTSQLTASSAVSSYILKLDSAGNYIWSKLQGGTDHVIIYTNVVDASGAVYSSGYFKGTCDFDPGTGTANITTAGDADIFVSKMDASGNYVWAKTMGSTGYDLARAIDIDGDGNIYIIGEFGGTVDFDPSAATSNLISAGWNEVFVTKLNTTGNFVWAVRLGGTSGDYGTDVSVSNSGDVHTTGYFEGTADFDPGTGVFNFTSAGDRDMFIQKMSQCSATFATDVHTSCDSYTWINGSTYTSSNNTDTHILVNSAGCDSVVTLNLTINTSTTGTDVQTACDTYTWIDGNTYTTSNNTAKDTLINAAGCDSVVTLNLTINTTTTSIDVQTACDTYTWIDGNTYTSNNNIATHTLANAAGCDSVVTLNLTINTSTTSTDVQVACDEYQWIDGNYYYVSDNTATYTLTNAAGCDSVVTLDLTINSVTYSSQTITGCNSYTWINGTTYTSSSMDSYTTTNAAGCDSTISLFLTINTVDLTVTDNSPMLTSNAPVLGHQYQWIDCNNSNLPISGETYQSFTATSNGDYAVIVTGASGTCTDTSACVNITGVGINETTTNHFSIYPNPTNNLFTITLDKMVANTQITVVSIEGKEVYNNNTLTTTKVVVDATNWSKGVYVVKINNNQYNKIVKLIKE